MAESTTFYAWSPIDYGAEVEDKTILKRNVIALGDEVTQDKIGVSDEEWKSFIDTGVVRDYPLPEELRDRMKSPNQLIAEGLADSETVAATYGVSPELVEQYTAMQKKNREATLSDAELDPETGEVKPANNPPPTGSKNK